MQYLIIIILSLLCTNIYGQSPQSNIKEIFNSKLAEYSNKNKTIECNFTHTKHLQKLTKDIVMLGKFYYNNNGAMALRYSKPQGDMVIIKDDEFIIVIAGKTVTAQGNSNPMMEQITQMMKACMTGDISQLGKGWETAYYLDKGKYIVELSPQDKRTKKYITKITLTFNGNDLSLEKLYMHETSGNYSQYEFSNKVFNKAIDASKFNL